MRVLYVPNEAGDFRQDGFRRPLVNLRAAGLLTGISAFSLQWRIQQGGMPEQHRADLIRRVKEFRPDVILMQHVGFTGLRKRHFDEMRKVADFRLVYHEADPYSRWLHPLPTSAREAGRAADIVFTVGRGVFRDNFLRAGARCVEWVSHCFEPERYRRQDPPSSRPYDIVIVANRNTPRFRGLPNWRDRIRFVEYMQKRFNRRLAVYGRGWEGGSAKGAVPFSEQDRAIRSGWVSANWDHFASEPWYFSNRLPISLSVGSLHATTEHHGYGEIFDAGAKGFLRYGTSFEAVADGIEQLLDTVTADRVERSLAAQDYAYGRFRQDDQLLWMLHWVAPELPAAADPSLWDLDAPSLVEV